MGRTWFLLETLFFSPLRKERLNDTLRTRTFPNAADTQPTVCALLFERYITAVRTAKSTTLSLSTTRKHTGDLGYSSNH